jgi:hypothetical protein
MGLPEAGGAGGEILGLERLEKLGAREQFDDTLVSVLRCHVDLPYQSHRPIEHRRERHGNLAAHADPSTFLRCIASLCQEGMIVRGGNAPVAPNPVEPKSGLPHMPRKILCSSGLGAVAATLLWLATSVSAVSQNNQCVLVPDNKNPSEKIMQCGTDLVVRAAPGTVYHAVEQQEKGMPKALLLDSGALLIEFHPNTAQKTFQILTPQAVAAVRGTKWAVDVQAERTSTLVISGEVAVSRLHSDGTVILGPGQGVDIPPGTDPIAVKIWGEARVRALLARFGE